MPQRLKKSGDALGNTLGTGRGGSGLGKAPRNSLPHHNINPNNHSPISMELLGTVRE
jgi:hypothetical protein